MTGPLAWLARLAILTLSLLATLSILGAIASIGSADGAGRPTGDRRVAGEPGEARQTQRTRQLVPADRERGEPAPDDAAMQPGIASEPARPPGPDPLRWLEPLTYAVLALAVLAAMAVLLLWRIALQLEERR